VFKNILLPTDGSELSRRAIAKGVQLAKAVGAKVTGLSVVLASNEPRGTGTMMLGGHVAEEAADEFLKLVIDAAKEAGVEFQCCTMKADSVHEAVVATVSSLNCDLICMGSHGRSYLGKIIHGSEVASVLAECDVPVLVFR
jgi:nucleotide-binding universal stress UspA family protein